MRIISFTFQMIFMVMINEYMLDFVAINEKIKIKWFHVIKFWTLCKCQSFICTNTLNKFSILQRHDTMRFESIFIIWRAKRTKQQFNIFWEHNKRMWYKKIEPTQESDTVRNNEKIMILVPLSAFNIWIMFQTSYTYIWTPLFPRIFHYEIFTLRSLHTIERIVDQIYLQKLFLVILVVKVIINMIPFQL